MNTNTLNKRLWRILSAMLVIAMILTSVSIPAFADDAAVGTTVYLTVSDKGTLAAANDNSVMLNKPVTVTDINNDGKLTVDEALTAAHNAYNQDEGYAVGDRGVTKLWGISATNVLFFVNNVGLASGVTADTVSNGDSLVASVNSDNQYYADWYTYFGANKKQVSTDQEFTLNLKGHLGMAYTDEDKTDVAVPNANIGLWKDGKFEQLGDKKTNENGDVTLSFDTEGVYYVTASGTVSDEVTDYSTYPDIKTVTVDCPIIAPGCIVTVEKSAEEPSVSDADAVAAAYDEFSNKKNGYSNSAKTPLVFPLEYEGVTYTNVIEYLKAWVLKNTGRRAEIEFEYVRGASSYTEWSRGYAEKFTVSAFDKNGDIITDYFRDNDSAAQRLSNVYFTVGGKKSEKVASIYVKSKSKERSTGEIVDYVAANLPFEFIKGKNNSASEIVSPVGEVSASGAVGALPTALSGGLYTKTKATISWSLANKSGKTDAIILDSKNKTTVTRPNVGEEAAKFTLAANISAVGDSAAAKTVEYELSVPPFDEVVVPVQVTKGAAFSLKDEYYKAAVDDKYVVKQENAPEGYDLYLCRLHTSATGALQKFTYTATKENCISKSGTINVKSGDNDTVVIDLPESSENDYKLGNLEILAPTVNGFEFSPDTDTYEIEVKGAQSVKIGGSAAVDGATVKITSYYKTLTNANKNELTTTGTSLSASGTLCYLPDSVSESEIKITVTAPESSIQTTKTKDYIIKVNKTAVSGPLTKLSVKAASSSGGKKNNVTLKNLDEEEVITPTFVAGGNENEYRYTVNYSRDSIKVTPTAAGCTIKVNDSTVASGKESADIPLGVGDNNIVISVTKGGATTEYKLRVHRKAELYLTDITLDKGNLATKLSANGGDWTGSCNFENGAEKINVTYHTNVTDGVSVQVDADGKTYTGAANEPIEIPVGDKDSIMTYVHILRTVDGVDEGVRYVISFKRLQSDAPSAVESYLPAPGQFINLSEYQNPDKTLTGSAIVTLGAFGGNIIYKYDEPIQNNPNNPYGIDFIVLGNCFQNSDGTTSEGAAEPAAVMVSQDGKAWYELAGSEYYTAAAQHDYTLTYTNSDTGFEQTTDVKWTDSEDESGVLPVNEYHKQPYYPNPEFYNSFNRGVGKNDTYTAESVSFGGTKIDAGFYPFGYADSHSEVSEKKNSAANPYLKNHETFYNGDGFDLSWAVDDDGNPVKLDEISYIKLYNPTFSVGAATGEKSPEIKTVLRAKAAESAVGTSGGLSKLSVNGEAVELKDGEYTYSFDGKGASSFEITPTAENTDANIYVSNLRVNSGAASAPIAAVDKIRIIVQEGEKEPLIYMLNFSNVETKAYNADLSSLTLVPGDTKTTPDKDGKVEFSVENSISAIRITPEFANKKATAVLSGGKISEPLTLLNKTISSPFSLDVGDNEFTLSVTSENGNKVKEYKVVVTRNSSSGSSSGDKNTITVKFSLVGDTKHYNSETGKNTGSHKAETWISQKSVTIPKDSTLKYLTEMMLNNAGLDYKTDGVYVSEINGIGQFDNGGGSGWMYRRNGIIENIGYAALKLSDGDVIKWFYTDDYTKETGYDRDWGNNSSSSNKNTGTKKNNTTTNTKTNDNTQESQEYTNPFTDVKSDDWFSGAIEFVHKKNLMKGVSDNEFAPNENLSRAMIVTILYRMENEPSASFNKFGDVNADEWYGAAVAWASENGIVNGVSENEFAPNDNLTREQMAAIIYRYIKFKGKDVSVGENTNILSYTDAESVSEYAVEAICYAVGSGLMKGDSETTLNPSGTATRAGTATIIMRLFGIME